MILVQDTKKPNRDPFETSEAGFQDLVRHFGTRYKRVQKVIVTPDAIVVTPKKEIVTPAKTKKG